ncbi:MAG: CDP-alcohol phosphatidyltransferase family protein [Bacteroidales bacterium]|jgi:phosphatidylglycerophosphate synthase
MKEDKKQTINDILKTISQDRGRTNILRKYEQNAIAHLVQKIPSWISSDMLTAIGFFGNLTVVASFVIASYFGKIYLLIGIVGFMISWFGDSLDGRVAYYRNKQRKWYGFVLDISIDWVGVTLMGLGFVVYVDSAWKIVGFFFVALYAWEIITALLRYKVTNKYSIDSGLLGPTEARILISLILVLEVLFSNSILYSSIIACVILLISNIFETNKLLKLSNIRDKEERIAKMNE